jgi:hypothetical protein
MLDKLLGMLTFDPMAFITSDKQAEMLRKIVGLDFTELNEQYRNAYERRASFKKQRGPVVARLDAMKHFEGVPQEPVSIAEVSAELTRAEELRKIAAGLQRKLDEEQRRLEGFHQRAQETSIELEKLERLVAQSRAELKNTEVTIKLQNNVVDGAVEALKKANDAVPDTEAIRQKIVAAEDTNQKVAANRTREATVAEAEALARKIEAEDDAVEMAQQTKALALKQAVYPVEGLGLTDDGVTFNGLPFEQASTAEQLRVSVAIGFALNPKLKVLLIRNGNALDDDSLKLVAEQAAEAEAQIWMEYVTSDPTDVAVMIVDGHQ